MSETKEEVATSITDLLGLPVPVFSTGSTEPKDLFTGIIARLGLPIDASGTKPELAEGIAIAGGQAWDGTCWSTGSTVTLEGLLRVRASVERLI